MNALHFNKAAGGRGRTEAYDAWRRTAGWAMKIQRVRPIATPVRVVLSVPRNPKRDVDGFLKSTMDLLVMMAIIPDDKMAYVEETTARWHDLGHGEAVVEVETVTRAAGRNVAAI